MIESEKNVKIKPHATSFTILQGFGGVRGEWVWGFWWVRLKTFDIECNFDGIWLRVGVLRGV